VNILVTSPEWVRLQVAILDALAPFPEATAAVKAALQPTVAAAS
jgi:hypothetical protein